MMEELNLAPCKRKAHNEDCGVLCVIGAIKKKRSKDALEQIIRDIGSGQVQFARKSLTLRDFNGKTPRVLYPSGLINLGNTCYMNTALQSMFHQSSIRIAVLAWVATNENSDETLSLFHLQKLFQRMLLQKSSCCTTRDLANSLRIDPRIQQDPEEFLKLFITLLLSTLPKDDPKAQKLKSDITFSFQHPRVCHACKTVTTRNPEETIEMQLVIDPNNPTLDGSFRKYFCEEVMKGSNAVFCENCGKNQNTTRKTNVRVLPRVLHLHLLRFTFGQNFEKQKDKTTFFFPEEIDLSFMFNINKTKKKRPTLERKKDCPLLYKLRQIWIHKGSSANGGHYVILVKKGSVWFVLDDENVEVLDNEMKDLDNKNQKSGGKKIRKNNTSNSENVMKTKALKRKLKDTSNESRKTKLPRTNSASVQEERRMNDQNTNDFSSSGVYMLIYSRCKNKSSELEAVDENKDISLKEILLASTNKSKNQLKEKQKLKEMDYIPKEVISAFEEEGLLIKQRADEYATRRAELIRWDELYSKSISDIRDLQSRECEKEKNYRDFTILPYNWVSRVLSYRNPFQPIKVNDVEITTQTSQEECLTEKLSCEDEKMSELEANKSEIEEDLSYPICSHQKLLFDQERLKMVSQKMFSLIEKLRVESFKADMALERTYTLRDLCEQCFSDLSQEKKAAENELNERKQILKLARMSKNKIVGTKFVIESKFLTDYSKIVNNNDDSDIENFLTLTSKLRCSHGKVFYAKSQIKYISSEVWNYFAERFPGELPISEDEALCEICTLNAQDNAKISNTRSKKANSFFSSLFFPLDQMTGTNHLVSNNFLLRWGKSLSKKKPDTRRNAFDSQIRSDHEKEDTEVIELKADEDTQDTQGVPDTIQNSDLYCPHGLLKYSPFIAEYAINNMLAGTEIEPLVEYLETLDIPFTYVKKSNYQTLLTFFDEDAKSVVLNSDSLICGNFEIDEDNQRYIRQIEVCPDCWKNEKELILTKRVYFNNGDIYIRRANERTNSRPVNSRRQMRKISNVSADTTIHTIKTLYCSQPRVREFPFQIVLKKEDGTLLDDDKTLCELSIARGSTLVVDIYTEDEKSELTSKKKREIEKGFIGSVFAPSPRKKTEPKENSCEQIPVSE